MVIVPVIAVLTAYFQKQHPGQLTAWCARPTPSITGAFNEGIMGAKTSKTLVRRGGQLRRVRAADPHHAQRIGARGGAQRAVHAHRDRAWAALAVGLPPRAGAAATTCSPENAMMLRHAVRLHQLRHPDVRAHRRSWRASSPTFSRSQAARRAGHDPARDQSRRSYDSPTRSWRSHGDSFHPKKENWPSRSRGEIEFEDVSFQYTGRRGEVLRHFNLHVNSGGTTVAIVGETGSGQVHPGQPGLPLL